MKLFRRAAGFVLRGYSEQAAALAQDVRRASLLTNRWFRVGPPGHEGPPTLEDRPLTPAHRMTKRTDRDATRVRPVRCTGLAI